MTSANLFDGEVMDRIFSSIPLSRVSAVSFLADDQHPIDQAVSLGVRVQSMAYEVEPGHVGHAREAHDLISWALPR